MLDLVLDPQFFQMDISCLPFWKSILDSLMTYDTTTFRELMGRVSLTQTGGLNIFVSRDQEYEQRAVLLKRLAFVIFCSELDQYHKYMPEIQGKYCTFHDSACTSHAYTTYAYVYNKHAFDLIPFTNLLSIHRAISKQSTFAIGGAVCTGGRIPLLPCAVAAHVTRPCYLVVADYHCRNGSSVLGH